MADPERSIAELLRQLVDDGNHLVRGEIRLAKAEVRDTIAAAARGAGGIGLGATLLLGAVLTLLGAAVAFLAPVVGIGWAAVIVGVAALAVGGGLIAGGIKTLQASRVLPARTVRSVKRDAARIAGAGHD